MRRELQYQSPWLETMHVTRVFHCIVNRVNGILLYIDTKYTTTKYIFST